MTSFPTPLPPTEGITITIDQASAKQVVELLIICNIPFHADLTFSPKKESASAPESSLPGNVKDEQSDLWESTPQFIIDMIKKGSPLSIEEMALRVKLAPHAFKTKFIIHYGKPFYQYYLEKRMKYASDLLRRGYKSTEVAIIVGYGEKSIIKFNKMFQKHFKITPKKYQKIHWVKVRN